MKKSQQRKTQALNPASNLRRQAQAVVELIRDMNPTDASDATAIIQAFSKTKSALEEVWTAFVNVYFPEEERMDLNLRSQLKATPLIMRGGQYRGQEVWYKNLESGAVNQIFIQTLLGMNGGDNAGRVANINRQLKSIDNAE